MSHKFDPSNFAKLESPARRAILPPAEIGARLGLTGGETVADVGCGIGYFAVPLAAAIGPTGQLYAVDISEKMLAEMRRRYPDRKNISYVHSTENNFKLPAAAVDMVFTATVFHEVTSPEPFLAECRRVLRRPGRLVIIDWQKTDDACGPPRAHRRSRAEVEQLLAANRFTIRESSDLNKKMYMVISGGN